MLVKTSSRRTVRRLTGFRVATRRPRASRPPPAVSRPASVEESGNLSKLTQFSKGEKRRRVREYIDEHPDAVRDRTA